MVGDTIFNSDAVESRGSWRFESAETFSDVLGGLGAWVGPRLGKDKRTHEQKELFCLRRFLVALKATARISYPMSVTHVADGHGPDFAISMGDGSELGLEVTEAGDAEHQVALAGTERSGALYQHGIWEEETVDSINNIVKRKINLGQDGKYNIFKSCDLLVYDNTRSGVYLDYSDVVQRLKQIKPADFGSVFRRLHIVCGEVVHFDVFGNELASIHVGADYDIDFAGWIREQVERLRKERGEGLDIPHLIEELEGMSRKDRQAFGNQLRHLLLHLLKWRYQPSHRSASWEISINQARDELEDLLASNPSFANENFKHEQLAKAYERARRDAVTETGLPGDVFPTELPFSEEEIFESGFFPDAVE